MRTFVYFFLVIGVLGDSIEEDPDEYYGVPLGAMHYSVASTSAEVYAADEFTIVFNHFSHHPRRRGCTAMMIGPPRSEDTEDVVPGHGVLIGIAQPLMTMKQRRFRRQFGMWPSSLNLDHLFMDSSGQNPSSKDPKASFSGIHIHQDEQRSVKNITVKPETTTTVTQKSSTVTQKSSTVTQSPTTVPASTTMKTESTTLRRTKQKTQASTKPLILFENKAYTSTQKPIRNPVMRWSSSDSSEGPGIMLMTEEEKHYRKPNRSNPKFNGPIPRDSSEIVFVTADPQITPKRSSADSEDFPRRAPAQKIFNEFKPGGFATSQAPSTTPLFWVIPDPHEKRRRERLEKTGNIEQVPRPPVTTPRPDPINPRFELPSISDKAAAFTLTNGAKITDYLWIGLYDQCEQRSVPLISLKNVDPPREERIAPLSGWSHNVTSYRVQILNCNTILIPGFVFDGKVTTGVANFYVGIGKFPTQIEKQVKATVVGQHPNTPLRSYDREDILIRLPKSYRTFDIDFISIYNPSEDKSYGHVIIPSLLVPPCAED